MPEWSDSVPRVVASGTTPSVGVALGGGAVRGAAHLGVLSVLDREGIRPNAIAGTSIGAIVGAGYAAGLTADELLEVFRDMSWFSVIRPTMGFASTSLLDNAPLRRFLRETLGLGDFDQLEIPFAAMATDLMTGSGVALCSGSVVDAALASSALPGLFPPVEIQGRVLVDGGMINNLPSDVARAMGAERVIAIDVNAIKITEKPSGLVDVWERSLSIMVRSNQPSRDEVAVFIEPRIAGFSFTSFKEIDTLYRRGREAAEEHLPALLALLEP